MHDHIHGVVDFGTVGCGPLLRAVKGVLEGSVE